MLMNVPLLYITVIMMLLAGTPKDLGNVFVTKAMVEMELIATVWDSVAYYISNNLLILIFEGEKIHHLK